MLVNIPELVTAYYTDVPDPSVSEQRVAFELLAKLSAQQVRFSELAGETIQTVHPGSGKRRAYRRVESGV
jgi:hypothetical protein